MAAGAGVGACLDADAEAMAIGVGGAARGVGAGPGGTARVFMAVAARVGSLAYRAGISVPVGDATLGHVFNVLGQPLDVVRERVRPGSREDPGLAHAAA